MSAVDVKIGKLNVDLIIVLDDFFFSKNDDFFDRPKRDRRSRCDARL